MKTTNTILLAAMMIATSAAGASDSSGLVSLTQDGNAALTVELPSGHATLDCLTDLGSNHAISGDATRRVYLQRCISRDGLVARSFVLVQDAAVTAMKTIAASPERIETSASISDDGRWIAYSAEVAESGEAQIDLVELQDWTNDEFSSAVRAVKQIDAALHTASSVTLSQAPFVSADGQFVVFQSSSGDSDSTQRDSHIYRYGRSTDTAIRIDENADGAAWNPSISADGTRVAFASEATNLVERDSNGWSDVFVWDSRPPLGKPRFHRASQSSSTPPDGAGGPSDEPQISANGEFVVYSSMAHDIAPVFSGLLFLQQNVFVHVLSSGESYLVNSPESTACKDTPSVQTSVGTWPICLVNGGNRASWNPVISSDGRYIAFETDIPQLIATWDDGFGEWLPGDHKPVGWEPDVQPRVLLRDMAEGRFYLQSARAVYDDALSRDVPGWYTTARGSSSCASMSGKPPLGLSLSADGQSTVFQVSDQASHCAMQSASFGSYRSPDADKTWSIFMKSGKGARSNSDPFP